MNGKPALALPRVLKATEKDMAVLYFVLGIISIILGLFATLTIKSDIQVIIVVLLVATGFILVGIADLFKRLDKLGK
jgi:uncharacterized membrane protein HdeD (DUF308 family)